MANLVKTLIIVTSTLLVLATTAAAEVDMQPGLWEITSEMHMPGMSFTMPPSTMTQCISKDNLTPGTEQQSGLCKTVDIKTQGNTVSWTLQCDQEGQPLSGQGKITYSGTTFDGVTSMQSYMGPGQIVDLTVKMKGRRLGPCQ